MAALKIIKIFSVIILSFVSVSPVSAQDFIARQAPVDRKVKAVDTLALKRILEREMEENPSYELYEEWDNMYAHKQIPVPDS